ncbi:hypothetical protein [Pseudomonas poae]|uniref:hypothetical protein n=1 Tax=Pseudomonas poae TaxID=200451 RepID=UPI0030D266F4
MNNLFMHAPKELSTDAFLAWFFRELEVNTDIAGYRSQVFHALGLIAEGEVPVKIEPELQSGNVDLLLNFEVNNTARLILFENKTSSTFHSDQLNRYRECFPNCDKYVYFKIGYVDTWERQNLQGYQLISAHDFYQAVSFLAPYHPIIDQYCAFLKEAWISKEEMVFQRLAISCPTAFKSAIGQRHLIGELYDQLKGTDTFLKFKKGVNINGTPWTQLDFCRFEGYYDGINETLFWRVDSRAGRTYLRINQYAAIARDQHEIVAHKKWRLRALRELASNISADYDLKPGKLSNKGVRENEVIIFFFDENPYGLLKGLLPEFTKKLQSRYYLFE